MFNHLQILKKIHIYDLDMDLSIYCFYQKNRSFNFSWIEMIRYLAQQVICDFFHVNGAAIAYV